MADYAIHDTTLIGTSSIIRKKEGSSALIDPADYPKRINLMGMLEEKTVSGAIADFSDGADDVPTKSLVVTIPPTLSGVSSLTEKQIPSRNLASMSDADFTLNSVRYKTENGVLHIDGTSTGETSSGNDAFKVLDFWLPSGTYYFSRGATLTSLNVATYLRKYDDKTEIKANQGSFTLSENTHLYISFYVYNKTFSNIKAEICINIGSTAITFEDTAPITQYTASLGRTVYGGQVDIVNGTGTDENGNDFTFDGQEIPTRLGYNAFWSDEGDTEVTYRASGTITPVVPTLITKNITENGTYTAEDDDADGYDEVTVNVETVQKITVHDGKLDITTGTITADSSYCYTDLFDCPSGLVILDLGEANADVGLELVYFADNSHANAWSASTRYREIDATSYYSSTKKARLGFRKTNLAKVLLMDFGNGKIYSTLDATRLEQEVTS